MRKILGLGCLLILVTSCAGVRRAQTGMRATLDNPVEQKFAWGEVYCGQGTVCSEIQVLRVDFENRNGGNVDVTLKNRTGLQLQAQIGLQIVNNEGAQLDATNFQDVGLPPSQQKVWSMPGVYQREQKSVSFSVEPKYKLSLLVTALIFSGACSRKPVQSSGSLPTPYYRDVTVPEIEKHEMVINGPVSSLDKLQAWNQKAGKPTFGLITGFYQLPESKLIGAVTMETGYSFGRGYEAITIKSAGPKPYAVLPASIGQMQVFSKTMNDMLDAGIHFVEVSMADADQVMRAEKKAIEEKSPWLLGQLVPSGVGYLISIEKGEGLFGPTYVGRVIASKDGNLIALGTQVDAGPQSLEPLLKQLVSDALRRLADGQ